MLPLLRLAKALIRPQVRLYSAYTSRRAKYGVLLAVFAGLAALFALALLSVALVTWLGLIWALVVELGLALIGAGVAYALMRAEARRHAREAAQLAEVQKQELRSALVSVLPGMRGSALAAAGIGAVLAMLLAGRSGSGDGAGEGEDPDA